MPAQFIVVQLRNPAPLDRKTVQMFERLFLADENCNYFVCHYGAVRPTQPEAEGVDGKFMSLPEGGASKYYVSAVNHFGNLNGFELLIQRLDQRVSALPACCGLFRRVSPPNFMVVLVAACYEVVRCLDSCVD